MGDTSTLADRLTRAAQDAELVIVDSVTDDDQQRIATAASALESDERSWVVFESGPFGATYAQRWEFVHMSIEPIPFWR